MRFKYHGSRPIQIEGVNLLPGGSIRDLPADHAFWTNPQTLWRKKAQDSGKAMIEVLPDPPAAPVAPDPEPVIETPAAPDTPVEAEPTPPKGKRGSRGDA